ncbi:MAG: cyclopropane fatty acyl phospholipid synthase [Gemmatimonas sp. SG8_17]|nr:MAG: cyclopropane fatty acyl phospholipid synthase [Gemmatimonas sp. SG8_17]
MSPNRYRRRVVELLSAADIAIDGQRPWDVQVHDGRLYRRVIAQGALGLGESYMDGWWDCERLDEFFARMLRADLDTVIKPLRDIPRVIAARLFNLQKPSVAFHIGRHHYDIGNDLYRCMLDRRMIYSCAYWAKATTLDEAQVDKLDLVCRKLGLEPGMRVLDIGCGWGGTAKFAAENYSVSVVGVTVSCEQAKLARQLCRGLDIDIRLEDYRSVVGEFDRVISIGMFEHVGHKNYRSFMELVRRLLTDDGIFLLHTIGGNRSVRKTNTWTQRYIFPNSMLPSVRQISRAIEGRFILEDWHGFGPDYDKTLMSWYRNFEHHWPQLKQQYDERFYRMWKYFLLSSAGGFRARKTQLWQIALTPHGVIGGYRASR